MSMLKKPTKATIVLLEQNDFDSIRAVRLGYCTWRSARIGFRSWRLFRHRQWFRSQEPVRSLFRLQTPPFTSLRRLLWLQNCLPKSETFHKPAWTSNSAFKRVYLWKLGSWRWREERRNHSVDTGVDSSVHRAGTSVVLPLGDRGITVLFTLVLVFRWHWDNLGEIFFLFRVNREMLYYVYIMICLLTQLLCQRSGPSLVVVGFLFGKLVLGHPSPYKGLPVFPSSSFSFSFLSHVSFFCLRIT